MTEPTPMFDPPHPGEFISEVYLEPSGLSARSLAGKLDVTPPTVERLVNGFHAVSPEMALSLSFVLGRSAWNWLSMQDAYDLWQLRKSLDLASLKPLVLTQTE